MKPQAGLSTGLRPNIEGQPLFARHTERHANGGKELLAVKLARCLLGLGSGGRGIGLNLDGRHRIGVENILFEVDYPHADSTWPDTQTYIEAHYQDLPVEEIRQITHLNAAKLFRHPLPAVCLP